MKVLFASDLHGHRSLYAELFAAAGRKGARAVILGGDLLPHHGPFQDTVVEQQDFISSYLEPSLRDFHRQHPGVHFYALLGNTDWQASCDAMARLVEKGLLKLLHGECHDLGEGCRVFGYGHVPPTPFRMKDGERLDISGDMLPSTVSTACRSQGRKVVVVDPAAHYHGEKSIAEELDTLPLPAADRKLILVIHSPPWNTELDVLFDGTHVGSRAVRHFIAKHRPLLALHGHIHESPEMSGIWIEHLGPTVCINPGHSPQRLHAVFFDLEDLPGEFEHLVYGPAL
jgi:Icc-related predicted phosphoesterase